MPGVLDRGGGAVICADCDRTDIRARGLCYACYSRHLRAGTLPAFERVRPKRGPECTVRGCTAGQHARGWCKRHYNHALNHGEPVSQRVCVCGKPIHSGVLCPKHRRIAKGLQRIKTPTPRYVNRLPAAPLRTLVAHRARERGVPLNTMLKELGLRNGRYQSCPNFAEATVDRVCCALGLIPVLVYGDSYYALRAPVGQRTLDIDLGDQEEAA